jgi:hypothetical protein
VAHAIPRGCGVACRQPRRWLVLISPPDGSTADNLVKTFEALGPIIGNAVKSDQLF